MSINVSFHGDSKTRFDAGLYAAIDVRVVRAKNSNGEVDLYLSDAQARELAETIIAALDADAKQSEAA